MPIQIETDLERQQHSQTDWARFAQIGMFRQAESDRQRLRQVLNIKQVETHLNNSAKLKQMETD